jgi:IPT/TIG domain-containing protein
MRDLQIRRRVMEGACVTGMILCGCTASSVAPSAAPVITAAQPLSGPVGTRVTITGTGFSPTANTINFGVSAFPNVPGTNGSIVFFIPMQTNPPCRNATPPCEIATALITPGDYALSVSTLQGMSNAMTFTVTK